MHRYLDQIGNFAIYIKVKMLHVTLKGIPGKAKTCDVKQKKHNWHLLTKTPCIALTKLSSK